MTDHHRRMLRLMEMKPSKFYDFTNATLERSILAPSIALLYLTQLVDEGFAILSGEFYAITEAGVTELEKPAQIVPAKTFCNAQMTTNYKSPAWPVRAGADQHLSFHSRGIGA